MEVGGGNEKRGRLSVPMSETKTTTTTKTVTIAATAAAGDWESATLKLNDAGENSTSVIVVTPIDGAGNRGPASRKITVGLGFVPNVKRSGNQTLIIIRMVIVVVLVVAGVAVAVAMYFRWRVNKDNIDSRGRDKMVADTPIITRGNDATSSNSIIMRVRPLINRFEKERAGNLFA